MLEECLESTVPDLGSVTGPAGLQPNVVVSLRGMSKCFRLLRAKLKAGLCLIALVYQGVKFHTSRYYVERLHFFHGPVFPLNVHPDPRNYESGWIKNQSNSISQKNMKMHDTAQCMGKVYWGVKIS